MSRRRKGRDIHGILLLDKPAGYSSNQAVQKVRWLYQARKAGHTGSLDPFATGMLPICLGEASKTAGFMLNASKTYLARAMLGQSTTTGDIEGEVVASEPPPNLDAPGIEAVLARFEGIRDLSYWWVAGSAGMPEEALRAWLAADQSFLRRPAGVFVVRLSIDLKPRGAARDAAERSLREFSRLLSPSLKAPPQGDPKARLLEEPMALVRSQRPGLP